MAVDISTLGVVVKSDGITKTSNQLEKLAKAADKAEISAKKATDQIDKLIGSISTLTKTQSGATAQVYSHITAVKAQAAQMGNMGNAAMGVTQHMNSLQHQITKTGNAMGHTHEKANILINTLKSMIVVASIYIGLNMAKGVVELADAWGMMQAKLKIALGTLHEAKAAQEDLFNLAQKYRSPMEDMTKLYVRLNPALEKLGKGSKDTKDMVEGVSLALKLQGATAAEASSTMLQFSQAANAGRLNGAEFNAVSENGTLILRALEEHLGKTRGELKKMGSDGELTFDLISAAMAKMLPKWRKDFEELPLTVEGAMQRVKNAWAKAIGEEGQQTALGKQLAEIISKFEQMIPLIAEKVVGAMQFLIDHGDKLVAVFSGLVALKAAHWAVETATGLGMLWKAAQAAATVVPAVAVGMGGMGVAAKAAVPALGLLRTGMAFLGGPIGIVTGLLAAGVTAWQLWGDKSSEQSGKVATASTYLATKAEETTQVVLLTTDQRIEAINREIEAIRERNKVAGVKEGESGGTSRELSAALNARFQAAKGLQDANTPAAAKESLAIAVKQWDVEIARLATAEQQLYLEKGKSKWAENYKKFMEDHASKEEKFLALKLKAQQELGTFYSNDVENRIRLEVFGNKEATKAQNALNTLRKQANEELQKTVQLYNEQYQSLQDIQQFGLEGDKRTKAEKEVARLQLEYAKTTDIVAKAEIAQSLAVAEVTLSMEQKESAIRTVLKAEKEKIDNINKTIEQTNEEAQKNEDLVKTFGMAKGAIEQLELARLEALRTSKDVVFTTYAEVIALDALIEAKKRNATAAGKLGELETKKKADEEIKKDWEKTVDKIDDVFRDGFADMLNNGKSAWKSFTKSLATTFKTVVADEIYKTFFKKYVVNLTSDFLGSVGLGSSGVGGAGGNASAEMLKSIGLEAAKYVPAAAAAVAAYYAGRAVSGGYRVGTGSGLLNSLGVAGGLVNRAFGRKLTDSGIEGNVSGSQFSGNSFEFHKGGWFRSDKTKRGELGADTNAFLSDSVAQMYSSVAALGTVLGTSTESLNTFSHTFKLTLKDLSAEDQAKAIEKTLADISDAMAAAVLPTWEELANKGETAGITLQRLAAEYTAVDAVMNMLSITFGAVGLSSSAARSRLIELSGGLDAFAASATFFSENFLTEDERIAPVMKQVRDVMASLGQSAVDTKDEFKGLVLGLKLTESADQELYAALMQIAPAFSKVADYETSLAEKRIELLKQEDEAASELVKKSLEMQIEAAKVFRDTYLETIESTKNSLSEAYERESSALKDAIKKHKDYAQSLRDFRDSLLVGALSNLSPEAKYLTLKSRFESTSALAKAGDETAVGQLQGISQQFLEASQGYFASSTGYTDDFASVRNALEQTASSEDIQASIAQQELNKLDSMVAGILNLNQTMLTVAQALQNYLNANGARGVTSGATVLPTGATTALAQGNPQSSTEKLVEQMYNTYLGRASDAQGLKFWSDAIASGVSAGDVAWQIMNSPEAQMFDGSHENGLNRVPFDGYRAQLHQGERVQTAAQARDSDETAALMREVLVELKAQTRQGGAAAQATVERLEKVADKLDKNTRKLAATSAD
jgi:tape measure domain-containing protein